MAKEQIIYSKSLGINANKTRENLDWNQNGETELEGGSVNFFIDDYGKISRFGQTVINSAVGAVHTLLDAERQFFGVGTFLYELVNGVPVARKGTCSGQSIKIVIFGGVAYCDDGVSFFTVKVDGSIGTWAAPVSKKGMESTRVFSGPVRCVKAKKGFSRIFLLSPAGILFHSEPVGPLMFDYANNVVIDANPIIDFECLKGVMVVGTSKNVFVRTGEDFKQQNRVVVSQNKMLPNTLCSGFLDKSEVACFTVHDGMYLVDANGQVVKITEEKFPPNFFQDTFIGASIVDNRYTVYSSTGFSYTVNLQTKTVEKKDVSYSLISGKLGLVGTDLVYMNGAVKTGQTTLNFPSLNFGSMLRKRYRYLYVEGSFASSFTVTVSDENGNSTSKVVTPLSSNPALFKIPVSSVVYGQYLKVSLTTSSNFILGGINCLPLLKINGSI